MSCIHSLQKHIDAAESLALPPEQLTVAYAAIDSLQQHVAEVFNELSFAVYMLLA